MKDYSKSYFWRALRIVNVYPFNVQKWRSGAVTLFHRVTFWKFFNHKKCMASIEKFAGAYHAQEEEWQRIKLTL